MRLRYKSDAVLRSISFLLIILSLLPAARTLGMQPDTTRPYILFPKSRTSGEFNYLVGLSITFVPKVIVEEGILQLPMIEFRSKYWLPYNLYLSSKMNFVYLTNQIQAGFGWSYSTDKFSFSVQDHMGYWFGFADFQGFDAFSMGLINYPGISIGYETDDLLLTLGAEAIYSISQHTNFGEASLGRIKPKLSGFIFTLAVEEELWKNNFFVFGTRFQYAVPSYQIWLAFAYSQRWLLYPELFIGYEL